MKKFTYIAAALIIIPQFALAAWWNPFSWGVFKSGKALPPQSQATSTPAATSAKPKVQPIKPKNDISLDIKADGSDGPLTVMAGKPVTLKWVSDRQFEKCDLIRSGSVSSTTPTESRGAYVATDLTKNANFKISCTTSDSKTYVDVVEVIVKTP
jgi:hypothetical protein